jgi:hypothetical protein
MQRKTKRYIERRVVAWAMGVVLAAGVWSGSVHAQQQKPAPSDGPVLAPPAKNRTAPKSAPADRGDASARSKHGDDAREDAAPLLRVTNAWTETRPTTAPAAATDEDRTREQVGRLVFSRMSIESEGAPLRAVLREVRRALGVNMIVFEARADGGTLESGIDGERAIDLAMTDTDGLAVLEALAALADADATWQVNRGTIEFGPKSVLARVEARRSAVVEVGDLALVPPDFKSCGIGVLGVESSNRLDSDEVLADLVRTISTHCEPSAFEPDPERPHDATALGNRQILAGNRATTTQSRTRHNPNTNAWRNLDPSIGPVFVHGRWASVQTRDTALALVGPDFVLRKVLGYPDPLPPREAAPSDARPATSVAAPTGGTPSGAAPSVNTPSKPG